MQDTPPSPVVGSWKLAPAAEALWVGPSDQSETWWANDEGAVAVRGCLFDDVITFGADGSVAIEQGDETWLEPWQGVSAEQCGAPVSPHDGVNDGTYTYDEAAGTITLEGQGTFIGLPKAYNGCEIGKSGCDAQAPGDAPSSLTYDVTVADDGASATFFILVDGNGAWRFEYVRN